MESKVNKSSLSRLLNYMNTLSSSNVAFKGNTVNFLVRASLSIFVLLCLSPWVAELCLGQSVRKKIIILVSLYSITTGYYSYL